MNYEEKLNQLSKSKFRSRFRLTKRDIDYINSKGLSEIRNHTYNFIINRLAPKYISNDGRQTPYHNHPVFIAQHATGTCCRNCLYKWYHIDKNKQLSNQEVDEIVNIIMIWIERQM